MNIHLFVSVLRKAMQKDNGASNRKRRETSVNDDIKVFYRINFRSLLYLFQFNEENSEKRKTNA